MHKIESGRGGQRKGAGRPAIPEHEKKKDYGTKLRPDQIEWLRSQYKAAAILERLIDEEMERVKDKEKIND